MSIQIDVWLLISDTVRESEAAAAPSPMFPRFAQGELIWFLLKVEHEQFITGHHYEENIVPGLNQIQKRKKKIKRERYVSRRERGPHRSRLCADFFFNFKKLKL